MMSKLLLAFELISAAIELGSTNFKHYMKAFIHLYTYRRTDFPQTVVVVGCSFAGYTCADFLARSLPTGWRVFVIEKKSHFQYTWLFPRVSVLPRHEEKSLIPFPEKPPFAPDGVYSFMQAKVRGIEYEVIVLEDGTRVAFAYLVLATGQQSRYPYHLNEASKEAGIQFFEKRQEEVRAANSIAVIGGGAVGVEIAFDIKSLYADKHVVLYHSRETLCNAYSAELHQKCMKAANTLDVDVCLQERPVVAADDSKSIVLKNGERRVYDLVINCIGQKTSSSLIKGLPGNVITAAGLTKVKETLQIQDENMPNVFVIGDIADTGVIKQGRAAALQGMLTAENILRSINGRSLKPYRSGVIESSIDISLGVGKKMWFVDGKTTHLAIVSKTSDETLKAGNMWKRLGAKLNQNGLTQEK